MKSIVLKTVLTAVLFFTASCGSEVKNNTEDSDPASDESSFPDSDAEDETSFLPGEDFFNHTSKNWLEFSFKGLINDYEDFDNYDITEGIGEIKLKGGSENFELTEGLTAFLASFPDDYENEQYRGAEYVGLIATETVSQESDKGQMYYLSAGVMKDFLKNIIKLDDPQAKPGASDFWATLYNFYYFIRKDKVVFRKFCPVIKFDTSSGDSSLFVDYSANKSFAVGENFIAWGNIVMSEEYEITDENEVEFCTYRMDETEIDKDKYETEIAKDPLDFSCELPEGFTDPGSEEYDIFISRGLINDGNSTDTPVSAVIERKTVVDGKELEILSYQTAWYNATSEGNKYIAVQSIGNMETSGDRYSFTKGDLYIPFELIEALKESGGNLIENAAASIYLAFSEVEQISQGNETLIKECPVAVADYSNENSSVFICTSANSEFAVGEYMEVASNFLLTHDPDVISEYMQYEGCSCYRYFSDTSEYETVECSLFDE